MPIPQCPEVQVYALSLRQQEEESGRGFSSSLQAGSPRQKTKTQEKDQAHQETRGREEEGRDVVDTVALRHSQLQAAGSSFPVFLVSSRMSTQVTVQLPDPGILSWLGRGICSSCNRILPRNGWGEVLTLHATFDFSPKMAGERDLPYMQIPTSPQK